MNPIRKFALPTLVALTLGACAGADPEDGSEDQSPSATGQDTADAEADPGSEDRSAETEAVVAEEPDSSDEVAEPTKTSRPAVADSRYDFGDSETNVRGELEKAIGQWGGISNASGDVTAAFRVTDIDTDFQCTGPYPEPTANGRFVALTMEVETTPELADDEYGMTDVAISSWGFTVFDEDSNRENDSVGNGYMCVGESEQLPDLIGPAQKASGLIILDTAVESGSIALDGFNLGAEGGWAWEF